MNAVVLRAAGTRAFSAGLDVKTSYGQPDNVWNHEDPGEALSPKWQKMWKPVVCAVQGMCTAGAFYFVNESDVVICSDDATFFDSHVSAGLVCALEPIGLMRRIGLGETLADRLDGQRRTRQRRHRAPDRARDGGRSTGPALGARPRHRGGHRRQAGVGDAGHREGDLGVAGQALPAAMEQGLIYTRLGNPIGKAELAAAGHSHEIRTTDPVMTDHPLRKRIAAVLDLAPDETAIEYDGQWFSYRQLGTLARQIATLVNDRGQVGILLRNRPAHVAAFLGVLLAGGTVVVINPSRGDDRTKADIAALELPVIIGDSDDLTNLVGQASGSTVISISALDTDPQVAVTGERGDADRPGVAVRMLTSGTTGPPKRIDLTYDMLAHSVMGPEPDRSPSPTEVRGGVAIVNAPLVHIGGVFRVLQCVAEARPFVLLERFELDAWADAVRRHRPRAVSLVPAALRMVLHSALRREDLNGIRAVTSGTAPLSAEDADAFQQKFGIPVLTSYAATEFGGGVAGWSLADHQKYWQAKRGSVGRANPGAQLRVVDDDGTPLGPDQPGLLEVKPGQLGPSADWIRTTDMARIDEDGFLWILGRADQAIIRGGFKVMPDDVRAALESHPAVRGAAVVGRPDERLGETPLRWWSYASPDPPTPANCSNSCETGWRATRFPPRSP